MAPPNAKSSTNPPAASDSQKTKDALWLFEQLMNCDFPVMLNVVGIAEATGLKPNTIVKRINTLQHRYPGFGIVTRTKGPRQSTNIAIASPVADTSSSVKKLATRKAGSRIKDGNKGSIEVDDEVNSKRKTRASSRVEQVQAPNKNDTTQARRQTRSKTNENAISEEAPTTIQVASKSAMSKRSREAVKVPDQVDNGADDADAGDTVRKPLTKQATTPKTRHGRKSAGIGTPEDSHADPERPAPRGRHAVAKKEKVLVEDADSTIEVAIADNTNAGDGRPKDEHTSEDISVNPDSSKKRKRSATPESTNSPFTPSTAIKGQLDKIKFEKQKARVSHVDQPSLSDMCPPAKKSKPNDCLSMRILGDADAEVKKDHPLDAQVDSQVHQPGIGDIENVDRPRELPQLDVTKKVDINSDITAPPEELVDRSLTTPSGRDIDERSGAADIGSDNKRLGVQDDQPIRSPESPSAGRETPIKRRPRANPTEMRITRNEAAATVPRVVTEVESWLGVNSQSGQQGAASGNRASLDHETDLSRAERSSVPDDSDVMNAKQKVDDMHDVGIMNLQQSQSSSRFSKPLEWMIWNPTAKPEQAPNVDEIGRVLSWESGQTRTQYSPASLRRRIGRPQTLLNRADSYKEAKWGLL